VGELLGVTHNRRSYISPYVRDGTIDPHVGIIRVDTLTGTPLATVWNFAIHGICYDEFSMKFSSDIMGYANINVENSLGGVSMFINGDAGDINPIYSTMCQGAPNFVGSQKIAEKVLDIRNSLDTNLTTSGSITAASVTIPFGRTVLNFTLARIENCTSGGMFDICSICRILGCDVNTSFPSSWIEENPRFTAFNFELLGVRTLMVSIPGEAITELGWWIRNDSQILGYNQTFLVGYTNNYLGYFTTPREYVIGGYESMLTLWGIDTAVYIRDGCYAAAKLVTPAKEDTISVKKREFKDR